MRAIKFRAWDGKSMVDVPVNHSGYRLNELMEGICDNYQLMQYTGLKDKNGKEIYEGDIVKYQLGKYKDPDGGYGPDNLEMFDEVAEIVYDESAGRFKRKDRFHDFIDTPKCEVIGNIYENPELLK